MEQEAVQTESTPPVKSNSEIKQRSTLAKIVFFLVLALIIVAVGYFGFSLLNKNSKTPEAGTETKKTATQSAPKTSKRCGEKGEFKSEKQGYSVCFPTAWVSKQLLPSDILVGFDQNQVEGSFPGTFSISISDKSEDLSVQEVISNSLKYEYSKITVANARGTKIIFDRLKTDPLSSHPKSVQIVLPKYDRTYTLTLTSTETEYENNLKIFDTFLKDFVFADTEPDLPWSESRNIMVYSPWTGDTVTNPFDVIGVAIAFEGVVSIRVKDEKNHTLTLTTVQAESGVERSSFKGRVSFSKPRTKKGSIEVFTQSSKDGEEQDKVTIPITFQD